MFDIGGGREKINMEAKLWYGGEDANKIISFVKIALQAPKMGLVILVDEEVKTSTRVCSWLTPNKSNVFVALPLTQSIVETQKFYYCDIEHFICLHMVQQEGRKIQVWWKTINLLQSFLSLYYMTK